MFLLIRLQNSLKVEREFSSCDKKIPKRFLIYYYFLNAKT